MKGPLQGKLVLYAPNSHTGGGRMILENILNSWPQNVPLSAFLDVRVKGVIEVRAGWDVHWVNPRPVPRLAAEVLLRTSVAADDVVLFLNSMPPLLRCKARVVVFLQNRNLIEKVSLRDFKFKQAIRIRLERIISYAFRSRVDEYVVQTNSFKRCVLTWYGSPYLSKPQITVFPFLDLRPISEVAAPLQPRAHHDFIYAADGLAHKNHLRLFEAWKILADFGHFPTLAITLPDNEVQLLEKISELKNEGLKINNLGWLSHRDLLAEYSNCRALIFPSLRESLGLPLVEVTQIGLPILASELDYVYDVCEPTETFDPRSSASIARAVKRFLKVSEPPRAMHSPDEFVEYVLSQQRHKAPPLALD